MNESKVIYVATDSRPMQSPQSGMERQILAYSRKLMVVRNYFKQGWKGDAHKHAHEQLVYVVKGHIKFLAEGKLFELHSGDSVVVAGDVPHQAAALEDSEVLDVFTPYRQDYVA